MMASSQVEVATSSPFDHRDSCFQNNLNNLCIPNDNSIDLTDLWVHQPQWKAPTSSSSAEEDYRPSVDIQPHDTVKNKWARAREIVFPGGGDRKQPVDVSSSAGAVSSLVQKWRGFEAEAKVAAANKKDSADHPADDDSIGDWESDRTVVSGRSSCLGRDSDFTESERLRVADIIRRLTTEDGVTCSPPRVRTSCDHQPEQSPVPCSPRIRGRQAYIDLLTQMERDRRNELQRLVGRKAVSQFSHRGRIQALLRLKFLRRGLGTIEGRFSNSTKPPIASHLRGSGNSVRAEKATDKAPAAPIDSAGNQTIGDECHLRACQDSEAPETSKEHDIDSTSPKATNTTDLQQNGEVLNSFQHHQHEENPFSKFIRQDSSNIDHSSPEAESQQNKEDQRTDHQVTETNYDIASDYVNPQSYQEEESDNNQQVVESDAYWVSDASHPEVGWEEVQSEEGVSSRGDWIGEVSRPRSDWEDLRQARYQEMLDPFLDNEEIRALLGRKSVSGFLSSGLREKIDQVFMVRCQGQQMVTSNVQQAHQEKHEETSSPEEQNAVVASEEVGEDNVREGGYGDFFDEFEEAESSLGQQYTESEYLDQTPAWPQNQGQESSVCSFDQVASTPTQPSPYIGPPPSYGAHHPTIEMELIYDLRRHMEQLHQEMSELRKSIKCCTDMQLKLQRSIKKEVTTALISSSPDHPANGRRNPTKKGASSGGRCCVCRKVQIDCVMYRCGHMCTCFKCAHELQWSSGKCPVCRSRIVDVVRTYSSNY